MTASTYSLAENLRKSFKTTEIRTRDLYHGINETSAVTTAPLCQTTIIVNEYYVFSPRSTFIK